MNLSSLTITLAFPLAASAAGLPNPRCSWPDDAQCPVGQFCELPEGACRQRMASIPGFCTRIPAACTSELNEVCGCDGATYGTACMAKGNGASVLHDGPCEGQNEFGTDYCTWSKDKECYEGGWPQCCLKDGQPCPPDAAHKPRCDKDVPLGRDYCAWGEDTSCYASGWPACCDRFSGTNCPTHHPHCDAGAEAKDMVGFIRGVTKKLTH